MLVLQKLKHATQAFLSGERNRTLRRVAATEETNINRLKRKASTTCEHFARDGFAATLHEISLETLPQKSATKRRKCWRFAWLTGETLPASLTLPRSSAKGWSLRDRRNKRQHHSKDLKSVRICSCMHNRHMIKAKYEAMDVFLTNATRRDWRRNVYHKC